MRRSSEVAIREAASEGFVAYAEVPIGFEAEHRLDLNALRESGGRRLIEVQTGRFRKDYDALEGPVSWSSRFDVSNWGVLAAFVADRRIGGAVIAFDTPGLEMLEGRRDLAVVWDLRVAPEARGRGIGRALWLAAVEWARVRGCTELRVETQDVNVAACRFYAAQGCELVSVDEAAYPGLAEAQILWSLRIPEEARESRS